MDQNTSPLTGGISRRAPRSDTRAWTGYISRQSTYQSNGQQPQFVNLPESLSSPKIPPTPLKPIVKTNYTGAFDVLPPKPQPRPAQPDSPMPQSDMGSALLSNNNSNLLSNAPANIVQPPRAIELPTDLPSTVLADQSSYGEDNPISRHSKLRLRMPKLSVPKVMISMATLLFISGLAVSAMSFQTNKVVKAQVKSATTVKQKQDDDGGITAGIPNEEGNTPSVDYYRTAATYPRVIRISKIKVEARVLALNIAPTGALKAPGTIYDAGWYKDSSRPGDAGAMVVDGHVSGPTKPGIFKNLGKLTKGDNVEIERGDGQKFNYTVTATKLYDADKLDMSSVMVSSVPGKPGLNIITCGGKFDPATNSYEQRTVVYTVLN